MIKNIIGDATKTNTKIIAHQTNCIGAMGAGIAKQIKQMMTPQQFTIYKNACKQRGADLLGDVLYIELNNGKIVANVFGEIKPTRYQIDTDYNALRQGLEKLHQMAQQYDYDITIPGLIGCGLAGGDWNYVLHEIIEPIFANSNVELTIAYFSKNIFEKYCK